MVWEEDWSLKPLGREGQITPNVIPYSGYFSGGKIFVVFLVEKRTTKILPAKQYCIVLGCGLEYCDHENFP